MAIARNEQHDGSSDAPLHRGRNSTGSLFADEASLMSRAHVALTLWVIRVVVGMSGVGARTGNCH
jgi:hypothetical protein